MDIPWRSLAPNSWPICFGAWTTPTTLTQPSSGLWRAGAVPGQCASGTKQLGRSECLAPFRVQCLAVFDYRFLVSFICSRFDPEELVSIMTALRPYAEGGQAWGELEAFFTNETGTSLRVIFCILVFGLFSFASPVFRLLVLFRD